MSTLTHWPENIEFTEGGFAGYAGFADKDETKIAFPLERLPNQIRYAVKDCMRVVGVEPDLPCIMALSPREQNLAMQALKLTYELRDIVVPILERRKAQLEKEYAKALEEETVLRAEAKKAETLYQRKVNGPVESLYRAISTVKDNISHLNEQRIDRTPATWLQSLS